MIPLDMVYIIYHAKEQYKDCVYKLKVFAMPDTGSPGMKNLDAFSWTEQSFYCS